MAELDSLQIRISASATQAEKAIDKLTASLRNLGGAMDSVNALNKFNTNITRTATIVPKATKNLALWTRGTKQAQKSAFSLAATIGKIYANYFLFMRGAKWIGSSITLASDLVEVQNVVDNVFTDMSDKMNDFAKTAVDTLGMSELTAKQIGSRFQAMGMNMGVPDEAIKATNDYLTAVTKMGDGSGKSYAGMEASMADVSLSLTKLAGDMASFYNQDYKDVAKTLESIFTGQTRPMRQYGLDLTEATLKEYALRNGLNSNIKAMSQYEKMLLRYQYVMANTTAAQGDFIRTQDTWANQMKIAKERMIQLKAVLGTIGMNTFKPLVRGFNNAMNSIIHLAESTLNALGKIFGWKVEISDVGSVVDDTEDIAGNMGDAAGAAKKMKDYMLGIDELNVFNPDDGKSGGGGASGGGADAAQDSLVKWEKTEKGYESIYDTLFKLGKRIGEVEKEWLQSIDWDKIYDKAERFGKGLASFLNGYLSDAELFYEKGRFVANAINMIGHALAAFAEEFDGYQLGVDIGSWINGFTYNIDWNTLTRAATALASDIAQTINGAVKTTDWDMVGKTIANAINLAVTFASTLIKETDFAALGKAVASTLNGLIRNINAKEIAATIRDAIHGAVEFASTVLSQTDFAELGRKIGQFLKELKLMDFITDIARLIGNVIVAALKLVPSMIMEAPFESALLLVVGAWKFTHVGSSLGGNIASAIATGLNTNLLPKLSYILTANLGQMWGNATIGRKAAIIGTGIGGSILAGIAGFNLGKGIAYVIADLKGDEEMKDIISNLGKYYGELFDDGFKEGIKKIGEGIKEMFKGGVKLDDQLYGSIDTSFFEKLGYSIADQMNGVTRTWNDVLADIQAGIIKIDSEDLAAMKQSMIDAGTNATDAITLVGQLEAAQTELYTYFPEWLEKETQLKNAVDIGAVSRQYAYQEYLKAKEAKTEEAVVTDTLTTSETNLTEATGTASTAVSSQTDALAELNEKVAQGEISQEEYWKKLQEVSAETDKLTESTKKTASSFNGMPSSIASAVSAMNESSDATLTAEEESTKFQELWNNYTISNIDISQLKEINTVLEEINTSSTDLVDIFEGNFEAIFTGLTGKLESAKTAIVTFDTDVNKLIETLFNETIPTDLETTSETFGTFLETTSGSITTFDEEVGKKITTLFDETLPTKFETLSGDFKTMLTTNEGDLTGSLTNVESSVGESIKNVQKKFEEFLKWFDKNILEKTKGEYWTKALSGVSSAFETTFRGVANAIATIMNSLIEQINSAMNVKWENLVVNGQTVLAAGQAKLFEITPIPMYERGGFPEDGLFYANHNELVGGFNGRTAVANNEQIVGGIREGVQEAMSDVVFNMLNPYLSDIAQSSRTTANKDFTVNLGDRDIAMAANRGQSLVGMSIIS